MGQDIYDDKVTDDLTIKKDWSVWRVVYDNVFHFLIIMLALELFSGLIIDTFGALREDDEK